MDNSAKQIFEFVKYAEKLKVELRQASKSDGGRESAAEHSWMLALLVMLVEPKLTKKIDITRALKMAIVHDLVEVEGFDVPVLNSLSDSSVMKGKQEAEQMAISAIRNMLDSSGQQIYEIWQEFEDNKTLEAKVVNSLDKLEGQWQFLSDSTYQFTDFDLELVPTLFEDTTKRCQVDPFLTELDEVSINDRKIRVFGKDKG